jgi:hypothetical protein
MARKFLILLAAAACAVLFTVFTVGSVDASPFPSSTPVLVAWLEATAILATAAFATETLAIWSIRALAGSSTTLRLPRLLTETFAAPQTGTPQVTAFA